MTSEYIHRIFCGKHYLVVGSAIAIIFVLMAQSVCSLQNVPNSKTAPGSIQGTVKRTDEPGQLYAVQGVQIKLTPPSGSPLSALPMSRATTRFLGSVGSYTRRRSMVFRRIRLSSNSKRKDQLFKISR